MHLLENFTEEGLTARSALLKTLSANIEAQELRLFFANYRGPLETFVSEVVANAVHRKSGRIGLENLIAEGIPHYSTAAQKGLKKE